MRNQVNFGAILPSKLANLQEWTITCHPMKEATHGFFRRKKCDAFITEQDKLATGLFVIVSEDEYV